MKNLIKVTLVISAIIIAFSSSTFAQKGKPFKGLVTFSISYTGLEPAQAAQQPKMMELYVSGDKSKMVLNLGPASFMVINDGEKTEKITLIDQGGENKIYFKTTKDEIDKTVNEGPKPTIKYIEETKVIAGFTCKKAEYTVKAEDKDTPTTITAWYSEELGSEKLNYGGEFSGLKGMALEYEMKEGEISTKFTATEVKKGKVKDTDFLVPAEFKELSGEEKQQMMDAMKGKE